MWSSLFTEYLVSFVKQAHRSRKVHIFNLLCDNDYVGAIQWQNLPKECSVFHQGCSTLFTESHGKDGFETAERCGVAVLGDRIGLVDPQDIVGEAAHSREDAGIFSDARRVFT